MITANPAPSVAAILEPLQRYASEIVIAADARVDHDTLAAYGDLADRLFRIEFRRSERHLAWLLAQCGGDWILRLDGDEVPSQAFTRSLPEMLASRAAQQFWTANAWLFPDATHVLDGIPWSQDFASRVVRNDATLRAPGAQHLHIAPITPREYREEPFYHLDLLMTSLAERRDKVVRYEVARPHLLAPGGGRINESFYLPELRGSLEFRPVPEEDRAAIVRALEGASPSLSSKPLESGRARNARFVRLEEMDRVWEGRTVLDDAYRASIEPYRSRISLAPSEQRHVFFRVSNEGAERWPGSLDESPQIRLAYRWLNPDGSVHTAEGPRSSFPRHVDPGQVVLAPLHVDAPEVAGQYVLEVDVVHENVRWFECCCRVPVRVEQPADLPAVGATLRETAVPRNRRWRVLRIPRTIHRVWLGKGEMPHEQERFGNTFAEHHPGWSMKLWTEEDLADIGIDATEREQCDTCADLWNLVRYEVLHRHGGIYVDTDVECMKPLTPLLRGLDAFAVLEAPGIVGTAILGAVAGHPAFARACRLARQVVSSDVREDDATGASFLSLLFEQETGVAILEGRRFYSHVRDGHEHQQEPVAKRYLVLHRAGSRLQAAGVAGLSP